MSADGYTAVVTGGSSGIGEDLCRRLLEQDYQVISIARGTSDYTHPKFRQIEADLLDPQATCEAAFEIAQNFAVTHLIHNAGMILPNFIDEAGVEDLQALTQLHAGAALILLQNFLPSMRERHFGRVIFNSSRASLGAVTRTAYSYSKAGLHGMAKTWALELGPEGITVNVVAPGPVQTDNFWSIINQGSTREKKLSESLPVRRLGKTGDVVRAMLYFADPDNSYVTGQILYVCGGSSIGGVTL